MSMKFKSIREYTTSDLMNIVFESSENNSFMSSNKEYDIHQNLILEQEYTVDGNVNCNNKHTYNEKNELIETNYLDEDDQVLETHQFFYDESGKLIKEHIHYGENEYGDDDTDFYDIVTYVYNTDNQLISKKSFDNEGEFNSEKKYLHDGKNIIQEQVFGEENRLEVELNFKYNEVGNLIHETRIDHIENVKNTLEHEYYENNHRSCSKVFNHYNDLVSKTSFAYNDKNQLHSVTEERPDSFVVKKYEFDDEGNLICENYFNKDEELMQYKKYSYENNLLQQIDQYVFSPESFKADEDGYLLNGSIKYEYELY